MKRLIAIFTILLSLSLNANPIPPTKRLIVLDPGHGGVDSGVKNDDLQEKIIVLEIARLIKERNPYQDTEFVIIRSSDEQMSNENRARIISGYNPDLVISLHINSNIKSSVKGIESHISPLNNCYDDSKMYAEKINHQLVELGFDNLGIKENNNKILRNPLSPTVMVHIGHLTNNEDKAIISDPKNYSRIADKILKALE